MTTSQQPQTDDELMQGIAAGHDRALEQLMQRYQAKALACALVRCAWHFDLAADVVQNTFATIHRRARHYNPQGRFVGYLYSLVQYEARAVQKNWLWLWWRPEQAGDDASSEAAAALRSVVLRHDLQRLFAREEDRQMLDFALAFDGLGMTHDEIAAYSGLTVKQVRGRISRAKQRIMAAFSEEPVRGSSSEGRARDAQWTELSGAVPGPERVF